jgi:hypothetical protein
MKLDAGNIWSGSRQLAVLTNPTCLAKRKGCLRGDYPITTDDGTTYPDIEAAYHAIGWGRKSDMKFLSDLMVSLMVKKFKQYPQIREAVKDSGGVPWLRRCSHRVNGGRWEGAGESSPFIACLIRAYNWSNPDYK